MAVGAIGPESHLLLCRAGWLDHLLKCALLHVGWSAAVRRATVLLLRPLIVSGLLSEKRKPYAFLAPLAAEDSAMRGARHSALQALLAGAAGGHGG